MVIGHLGLQILTNFFKLIPHFLPLGLVIFILKPQLLRLSQVGVMLACLFYMVHKQAHSLLYDHERNPFISVASERSECKGQG